MGERWLDREAAAAYICVRVDELARLVRAGRLPQPSYRLGPKCPRWDRMGLDAHFACDVASSDINAAADALVQKMLAG